MKQKVLTEHTQHIQHLIGLGLFLWSTASSAIVISYNYDNLDRLTSVSYNDQTAYSFTYDGVHNRSEFDAMIPPIAPTANDDSFTGPGESPISFPASGVLENDRDANLDSITAMLDTDALTGSVNLNTDGSFTYTPVAGFRGTDTFTYFATANGDNSNIATVTIEVVSPDTDSDGIPDDDEELYGLDPNDPNDAALDTDGDGLTNLEEHQNGLDPNDWDTDDDAIRDGVDRMPIAFGNECFGATDIVLASLFVLSGEYKVCASRSSIDVDPSVDVESGGELELISPTVRLNPGFSIPVGGRLRVISADPGIDP